MVESKLTSRAGWILKMLVDQYIREGAPISSQKLANHETISLSSASIRNVLADLEAQGFLHSPHPSSGRVPTDKAYRFFVNTLLTVKSIEKEAIKAFASASLAKDPGSILQATSRLLSEMTNLAGIVSTPLLRRQVLRHIEFLPISGHRILIILVLNEKEVQNRIIQADKEYSARELERLANFIMDKYRGIELMEIQSSIFEAMRHDWERMDAQVRQFMQVMGQVIDSTKARPEYVMTGEANLLPIAKEKGVESLQALLKTFSTQHEVLKLMEQCLRADGVQIFIGRESSCEEFKDCSFVVSSYNNHEGEILGMLGVVGPMRMDYETIIPMVDLTAKILSSTLN